MNNETNELLKSIRMWLISIWVCLLFIQCNTGRADDPNLTIDAPSASCECENLPNKQNVKDIKAIFKQIRSIASHPDSTYLHLHKKEKMIIKKKMQYDPSLEIYLP